MKNIGTGLLWFSAGVILTIALTRKDAKRILDRVTSSLIEDEAISEADLKAAIKRVDNKFKAGKRIVESKIGSIEAEINGEFNDLAKSYRS